MVNKNQRRIHIIEINLQQDLPHSIMHIIIIMEEKIMIIQGRNSEGLQHRQDHSFTGMYISFMVIVLIVLILDIKF
jgi:hypothetical protein